MTGNALPVFQVFQSKWKTWNLHITKWLISKGNEVLCYNYITMPQRIYEMIYHWCTTSPDFWLQALVNTKSSNNIKKKQQPGPPDKFVPDLWPHYTSQECRVLQSWFFCLVYLFVCTLSTQRARGLFTIHGTVSKVLVMSYH